jgi:hypothetical protein
MEPRDDQQRPTLRIPGIDFRLRPGIEVGRGRVEQSHGRPRHGERSVKLLRLLLADRICEGEAELRECQRDRAVAVDRIAEDRPPGFQRREREREDAAERRRIDRHRRRG